MKKIGVFVILLLVLFVGLRIWYRYYGKGHNYTYYIDTNDVNVEINETFYNDGDNSNYYFTFKIENEIFYYQTFNDFKKNAKIVKDIYYYNDDKYNCFLPVFNGNKIITDVICRANNGYYYFYNSLRGMSRNLDDFVLSLETAGYNYNNWLDTDEYIENFGIKIYNDNLISKHYLLLTNYKGVYLINNNKKNKINNELFINDVYQSKFEFIYKDKYIVADYNQKYRFHEFIVVDMVTGKKGKITSNNEISFDSYVQGIVQDKIYFFDKDSKNQYMIDMQTAKVTIVGNEEKGIKIYNGTDWEKITAVTASNNEIKFEILDNLISSNDEYVKIKKINYGKGGYNYYFKKVDDRYLVYRSNIQDNEQFYYLFTTSNLNNIHFNKKYIYFVDDKYIKRYSDDSGIRKIVQYEELKFNDSLILDVYIK